MKIKEKTASWYHRSKSQKIIKGDNSDDSPFVKQGNLMKRIFTEIYILSGESHYESTNNKKDGNANTSFAEKNIAKL